MKPSPSSLTRLVAGAALIVVVVAVAGCSRDNQGETATSEEIEAYFARLNAINAQAYGRFELLVRILDDSSYTEGLSVNSRRFDEGANALRNLTAPATFEAEHDAYAAALKDVADELEQSLQRIYDGEDVTDQIVSQVEGPLADKFAALAEACRQIARQADELGVYDATECGGDPYFIEAVEPPWSHRVHVNRCCGGSHPLSNPLDIFYGSDDSWERTVQHYKDEMTKRGFQWTEEEDRIRFSRPNWPEECFFLQQYREESRRYEVDASDVADLGRYDHAYQTGYTLLCLG
ncbi:MAG: hypothetical protein WEB52_11420 [Dehalococcoidia bacterium]